MQRAELRAILEQLVRIPGPSGFEDAVASWLARAVASAGWTAARDPFGNLLAWRPHAAPAGGAQPAGPLSRFLLAAHMDQVGLVVRAIRDDGFLRFEPLGGLDPRVLLARAVTVCTRSGPVSGVVGVKSFHLHRGRERRAPPLAEMYIDVGAGSADAAAGLGVAVGDPVVVGLAVGDPAAAGVAADGPAHGHARLLALAGARVAGPALDDRAGCAALVALIRSLREVPLPVDLVVAFTAQEEVGTRGARYLAHRLAADLAVAVDTTVARDTPELAGEGVRLGAGPAVKHVDAGIIAHPQVVQRLEAAAARTGIPWQREVTRAGATDARQLQIAAPTGGVGIPIRYAHSPVEVLDLDDLTGAVELLRALVLAG